jgi:hypothetical protein
MWGAILGAAAPIVTGILGGQAARQQSDEALSALDQARGQFAGIALPDIEKLRLRPEELTSAGQLTPEELAIVGQLGPSAFEQIQLDPRLRGDQLSALDMARQRALGGFTAEDAAMLDQYMRGMTSSMQSQQQAVLQDAARRGVADSGMALAAALQGGQGIANQASEQALQRAAMRIQQQQSGAEAMGRLAAGIEASDYSRGADLAGRRDAISEFNQRLAQSVADRNTALRNEAQQRNLAERQRIQDANVAGRNQAQLNWQDLNQQNFQNQMSRAGGTAGQLQNIANERNRRGAAESQLYAGIGRGISGAAGALGGVGGASGGTSALNTGGNSWMDLVGKIG